MSVTIMMRKGLSLRKSLSIVGASRGSYYYKARRARSDRGRLRDPSMLTPIKELAMRKPVYGSRMLAARLSKELGRPVNRKLVQHAFRMMGWTIPQMTKKQLIGAAHKKPKPTAIDQDWEADFTYVWCGVDRWCYLFNVLDIFSRECRMEREAKRRHVTLNSLINAILAKYDSFDKILEGTKAIPLSGAFVAELLEIASIEQMENIAKKLGAKVVRQSFASQGIEFNLDNLIESYFEPLSEYSGWYQFDWRLAGTSRKLIFTHSHGAKWTAFLRRYYAAIIRSATGVEPDVTFEDGVLTFTCR